MFSLFRKKPPTTRIIDKVWMTETAKFRFLLNEALKDGSLLIGCWFEETAQKISSLSDAVPALPVLVARELRQAHIAGKRILFAEHHPLFTKEETLFQQLNLVEVTVCSSLDEPLFSRFGGERIAGMMQKLGMAEMEMIEHEMVSRSIRNAQEKIVKEIVFEQSATSQQGWIEKNLPR